jgi:hypothetical protein
VSSQGGDAFTETDSRLLLEAWGVWARSGDLGLGFQSLGLWRKSALGVPYTEADMVVVDRVVAQMPTRHKRVAKKVFLFSDRRGLRDEDIAGAVGEFHALFQSGQGARL